MKHLKLSIPTVKGHLKQEQQGLQSTKNVKNHKPSVKFVAPDPEDDLAPPASTKTKEAWFQVITLPAKATTYSDQTGCFPHQSSTGNNYVMVCYDYDANAILVAPLKKTERQIL